MTNRSVTLPSGERVPALGQGTWRMGDDPSARATEVATLRLGIDLGLTLIDTAEMYGDGASEQLVADAIAGRRDDVFLVSKVLPHHATARGTIEACERSLKRLRTDRIDLYLLHWRGHVPLAETLEGFGKLVVTGKIRHWGVSNFDTSDMEELASLPGGSAVAANQILYNLVRRGTEWDLLPWLRHRKIPAMAYSPIEQAKLAESSELTALAQQWAMTPTQVALAWLLRDDNVIAIPKTSQTARVKENAWALRHRLTHAQLAELDRLFPPPDGPTPLEMI